MTLINKRSYNEAYEVAGKIAQQAYQEQAQAENRQADATDGRSEAGGNKDD